MTRSDGRTSAELRPTRLTPGFLLHAEGSVLIEVGRTRVVCSASVEDRVPPFLRNTGKGWVTAEYGMLPRATSTRTQREATAGKVGGRTQEIQRLIGRSLRSVTRLPELGERTIWVDCDVIQADGGTRTASITGGFVAMVLAMQRMRESGTDQGDPGARLRRGDERRRRRRHADAGPRLRGGLARRRGHEHRQDRRRAVHRGAGHGRRPALRAPGARRPDGARRQGHPRAGRAPADDYRQRPAARWRTRHDDAGCRDDQSRQGPRDQRHPAFSPAASISSRSSSFPASPNRRKPERRSPRTPG